MIRPRSDLACAVLGLLATSAAACAPAVAPTSEPAPIVQAPVLQTPPDSAAIATADSVLVRFATTRGDIDVMVRRSWAPYGAPRVAQAVAAGYYDGARFFRALRGFVVQWGIAADTASRSSGVRAASPTTRCARAIAAAR